MPRSHKPVSASDASPSAQRNEYIVDELARVTDSTVRNIRAYQDRGLLAPPEKRGPHRVIHVDCRAMSRSRVARTTG